MDRRQQKTRQAVFAAFEELIAKKRYNDITVQNIIDLANIGRTTFYAHFETKDSVLDALCEDLFSHIFKEHLTEEDTHDFSAAGPSENNQLTHILYHLKADKTRYRKLFTGESADIFWLRFKTRFESELKTLMQSGDWQIPRGLPPELFTHLYVGSFIDTVTWWFGENCAESPEQIVSYFEAFRGRRS